MDSRLKERLIGAIALVAIVVIVVPELLTGQRTQSHEPAPPGAVPQRTVSFVLGSAQPGAIARTGAAPATTAPGAAPPAATEPATPAGAAPNDAGGSAVPLAEPAPAPSAPAASDAQAATVAPATGGSTASTPSTAPRAASVAHVAEAWIVQLGSFVSRDNAERLAAALRGRSYAAFVSEFRGSGRVLYRVRVGPEHDRARADAIAARLAHEGHPGSVVPEP